MTSPRLEPFWRLSGGTLQDLDPEMQTVTIGVSSIEETNKRVEAAVRGERHGPRIDFLTVDLFLSTMTEDRWKIVRAMAGAGSISAGEVAQKVGRDVKLVESDMETLLRCGVLYEDEDGRPIFPFRAVHVDFMLKAAA